MRGYGTDTWKQSPLPACAGQRRHVVVFSGRAEARLQSQLGSWMLCVTDIPIFVLSYGEGGQTGDS